jgi:hypothetical protein
MHTKKQLLESMCLCADGTITCTDEYGSIQKAFKPGVGDKFIFNMILNDTMNQMTWDYESEKSHLNTDSVGMNLMETFYYPNYNLFDREQDEEARRA